MSGLRRTRGQVQDLAEGDVTSTVNWGLLNQYSGGPPTLLWQSIPHGSQIIETDVPRIPVIELIGTRYRENVERRERDHVLSCKAFWDAFQRSKLVILFDRYLDKKLLRRLRDELEPGQARSLQTLIVFAGKEGKAASGPLVKDIETAISKAKSPPKFHYLDGMMSNTAPFPHDRFAVTDGEFWHFGGSVGGVQECLTAVSRGWKAKDVGVEDFVKSTWAAMAEGAKND